VAYPDKPASHYDYVAYQAGEPTLPLPAAQVAADFDHLKEAADETIDFLKTFVRSDGVLKPNALPTAEDLTEYTEQAIASAATATAAADTASAAATAAAASFDAFDDRYLGAKASNPTLDNDGNALIEGALYFNTVSDEMRCYDGASWLAITPGLTETDADERYLQLAGGTLSGALTLPNSSPSDDNHAARKKYIDDLVTTLQGAITALTPPTGRLQPTWQATPDTGWIMLDDGTIGDASSSATNRANADTSALFTLLWTNCTDGEAAVSGGRGANAAADFAAHKTIALPKSLSRLMGVAGAGSGLTSRALGVTAGAETVAAEMPSHTHGGMLSVGTTINVAASESPGDPLVPTSTGFGTGGTTGSASSGDGTMSIMPPSAFCNWMVKL